MASRASTSASTSTGSASARAADTSLGVDAGTLEGDPVEALGQPADGVVAPGAHLGQHRPHRGHRLVGGQVWARQGGGQFGLGHAPQVEAVQHRPWPMAHARGPGSAGLGTVWRARPGGEVMAATVVADATHPVTS